MQCHLNDVTVSDVPMFLLRNPTLNDYFVIILSYDDDMYLDTPLKLQGVTSYFPLWTTILSKYKHDNISKFHLTAEALMWDPQMSFYSLQEVSMIDFRGCIV